MLDTDEDSSTLQADCLNRFRRDIGEVSVLSREVEHALFAKVREVYPLPEDGLRDTLTRTPKPSDTELVRMGIPVADIPKLFPTRETTVEEALFRTMARLVIPKVVFVSNAYGVPPEELLTVGNIALLIAITRFDHTRGLRLSTYAGAMMVALMMNEALECRLVRVPREQQAAVRVLNGLATAFLTEFGREPTREELERLAREDGREYEPYTYDVYLSIAPRTAQMISLSGQGSDQNKDDPELEESIAAIQTEVEDFAIFAAALSEVPEPARTYFLLHHAGYSFRAIEAVAPLTHEMIRRNVRRTEALLRRDLQ